MLGTLRPDHLSFIKEKLKTSVSFNAKETDGSRYILIPNVFVFGRSNDVAYKLRLLEGFLFWSTG
jgi:hypothetical protein